MKQNDYLALFEAMLFLENDVLKVEKILKHVDIKKDELNILMDMLIEEYDKAHHGLRIIKTAGGFLMQIKKDVYPTVRDIYNTKKKDKLSKAVLTVLSIIAYKQPITKVEIEDIRGVSSDNHIRFLIEKNFVRITGRKDVLRKPLLYGTTDDFLKYFHLNHIKDLPKIDELKSDEFTLNDDDE